MLCYLGEEKRQSTPDSLSEEKERMKKKDDGYDSGYGKI